jgi:hypothetical protein
LGRSRRRREGQFGQHLVDRYAQARKVRDSRRWPSARGIGDVLYAGLAERNRDAGLAAILIPPLDYAFAPPRVRLRRGA